MGFSFFFFFLCLTVKHFTMPLMKGDDIMFKWLNLSKKEKKEVKENKQIEELKKAYEENMKLFKQSIERIEEAS